MGVNCALRTKCARRPFNTVLLVTRLASFCFESASGFYDSFDQGMVFFTQNATFGQPPFHVHAMVAASMQPRNVAVAPSGGMGPDGGIDATAGLSADGTRLTARPCPL